MHFEPLHVAYTEQDEKGAKGVIMLVAGVGRSRDCCRGWLIALFLTVRAMLTVTFKLAAVQEH